MTPKKNVVVTSLTTENLRHIFDAVAEIKNFGDAMKMSDLLRVVVYGSYEFGLDQCPWLIEHELTVNGCETSGLSPAANDPFTKSGLLRCIADVDDNWGNVLRTYTLYVDRRGKIVRVTCQG